jgi:DNA-binding NtrC family response regulator
MTYAKMMQRCATRYLRKCLRTCEGNVTWAARLAGVHRSTFYKLLIRYDIEHRAPRPQAHPRLNWPAPTESVQFDEL